MESISRFITQKLELYEGGPLISNRASEEQQRSFDSTCRKLHRFLKEDGCCG
jgi:hypothetical protein